MGSLHRAMTGPCRSRGAGLQTLEPEASDQRTPAPAGPAWTSLHSLRYIGSKARTGSFGEDKRMHQGRVVFGAMDEVVFGHPAAQAIVGQMDRLGTSRAFLMVSGTLNRQTDEIERIRRALGPRCVGTFDAMPQHTPREAVIAAAEQARAAEADLIVTVGGGSITDGAKAVQLCLANNVRTVEAIDSIRVVKGVNPPMTAPGVRQISVPTTIAGGEFSAIAGVTDMRRHVKQMLKHDLVMPRAVILDPEVTLHTPEWLFLSTGIRAVDHCVEGLCSREAHPYADAQALKGLSMLAQGLPRVKADPRDLDARMDCQIGTWLSVGPLAAGVPMGASHGIGYVLGAAHGVPHGYTSCVMLPAVLRWNKSDNADRQALVSAAMGRPGTDAADVLDAFIRNLGLPRSLREVQVGPEHFDGIARQAMATPWVPRNPRRIEGPAELTEILQLAA
jgi:maleylacetate reductase